MKKTLFCIFSIFICSTVFSQKQFYGTCTSGGDNQAGVIFKTDDLGNNVSVQYDCFQYEGRNSGDLIQASDGKFYGLASHGGVYDKGVLFQFDPATSNYIKKLDFDGLTNGSLPFGSLLQASDGMLYGMTSSGGTNDMGVLFQFNLTNSVCTKLLDFNGLNGKTPYGSLIQTLDGMLYGMTSKGGTNDNGVLFQLNPTNSSYIKKIDFSGAADGNYPSSSLLQASDGKLYGMTFYGGLNDKGVLFQYDPSISSYTKKLDFDGTLNGMHPNSPLIQAQDGMLYGMTPDGGLNNWGVLFQFDPAVSSYTKKLDFDGAINGGNSQCALIQASDGNLYGTTSQGGANNMGVLFQFNTSISSYTKKLDFDEATNGSFPKTLIQGPDGMLYGTAGGGSASGGVLFQFDIATSNFTKRIDFNSAINGKDLQGSLLYASDKMLYGMTTYGGMYDKGVLFQFDPSNSTYYKKIDFDEVTNGSTPYGSLIQATDGMLYGMTFLGGVNDMGVIFKFNPVNSSYTKLFDFNGTNGKLPYGSLIQATDGMLYGMTYQGGVNNQGVLFQFDPAVSSYTKKYDFDAMDGRIPYGSLIQASDGKLYGTTVYGGTTGKGVLFQFDPTSSSYTKKFDFGGPNGNFPYGSLIQASDGNLYGMTSEGGANNFGALFKFDISSYTYVKKLDFDGINNGKSPKGSLLRASDGMLYGMTSLGGTNDLGVMFQYNPTTSSYTKKIDFNGTINGSLPYGNIIEIDLTTGIASINSSNSNVKLYPNPTQNDFYIELTSANSKEYELEVLSITGQIIFRDKIIANNEIITAYIDVKTLQNGVYIVNLTSSQEKITNRIVVNK